MAKSKERLRREAEIARVRAECQKLGNVISRLEKINDREDAAPWLGKCFKYRNRDQSGKSWWLYMRVVRHLTGSMFSVLSFQSQVGGYNFAVDGDRVYLTNEGRVRDGYMPITRGQFNAALRKFTNHISALNAK
jgi:hypothetical protein